MFVDILAVVSYFKAVWQREEAYKVNNNNNNNIVLAHHRTTIVGQFVICLLELLLPALAAGTISRKASCLSKCSGLPTVRVLFQGATLGC